MEPEEDKAAIDTEQPPEEDLQEDKRAFFLTFNKYDQIVVQDKTIQLLSYEQLAEIAATTVFELLLSQQKTYPKKTIETQFEKVLVGVKDSQSKMNITELQKILESINLVDFSENMNNTLWIGPDCINITGVSYTQIRTTKNIEDVIVDSYRNFRLAFPFEISQRESSYFQSLYHTLNQDAKPALDRSWFQTSAECFKEHVQADVFEKTGFAVLKNKSVIYYIRKPVVVIGCCKKIKQGDFEWPLDLDLYPDPYVSRQHAIITFNFQIEKFEIRCLSKTNPIRVKDRLVSDKDDPALLEENCFIRIGKQMLWFSIMNEEDINNDELEEI